METLSNRYPRTLYEWLKSDDKLLHMAIADGQSVLEVAEDLKREHVSVLRRLSALELFEFDANTEEWAEVMGLGLAGVPLKVVLDWCNVSPNRLDFSEIESLAMGDLRAEFALACQLGILVPNIDVVGDLTWLLAQPGPVKSGYPAACRAILGRFDVVTPLSLKQQVLGLTAVENEPQLLVFLLGVKKHRAYSKRATSRSTTYRRKRASGSSTTSTAYKARSSTTRRKRYAR